MQEVTRFRFFVVAMSGSDTVLSGICSLTVPGNYNPTDLILDNFMSIFPFLI
jgi:hypothetical protein